MSATPMKATDGGNQPATDNGQGENEETHSAIKAALGQLNRIKVKVRAAIAQLDEEVSTLKTAHKEQRASAKGIQSVRAKLREIQRVEL